MLLWTLLACSPVPVAPLVDQATTASGPTPPSVWIEAPSAAVEGQPFEFRAGLSDATGVRSVRVFAAAGRGRGPCDPRSNLCLDLVGPRVTIDARATRNATWDLAWTPPAAAGARFWLQAVMIDQAGVVSFVDEPWPVDVVPMVRGCTFEGSPDYDPQATFDDGSCQCPRTWTAHNPAELAALSGCTGIELLTIQGAFQGPISLPDLTRADWVQIGPATGVTALELPALAEGRLFLDQVEGSFTLDLPAAQGVDLNVDASPGLRALTAPPGTAVDELNLTWNPNLERVTLEGAGDLSWAEVGWNSALTTFSTAADTAGVVEVFGNDALTSVALHGARAGKVNVYSNPRLETIDVAAAQLGVLAVYDNLAVTRVSLPSATQARRLQLMNEPSLVTADATSLQRALQVEVSATGLSALRLPALRQVGTLDVLYNPSLQTLALPVLGAGAVQVGHNPQLCATQEPVLANPPPGLTVTGTGNLCDP